ncbi:MAG: PD-(D/E)XK nuclease family protein [Acidimicrobiales bacterium]
MDPLTPAQQDVLDGLMAAGQARPTFEPDLQLRLIDLLEDGLGDVADRLDPQVLDVNKASLSRVHQCEAHQMAASRTPFEWSPAAARGTVAHRAVQMGVFRTDDADPLTLVDDVLEALTAEGDDWTPGPWLRTAGPQEVAEIRGDAAASVTAFQECFPPLKSAWRPRMEFPVRAALCADRIRLRSKVDLALGTARGQEARLLIVDFKTGNPWPGHLDDLRFYALLETLRIGVPPFRVATYYLDAGRWHHEDITVDLLMAASRRVVGGVTRLAELVLEERKPTVTPCGACTYCELRHDCEGAVAWRERDIAETGVFTPDPDDPDDEESPLPF